MKESIYKSYDELPLFLNANIVAKVLGVSPSTTYELMHASDFPSLRIGNRIVVPKEKFIEWVERNTAASATGGRTSATGSTGGCFLKTDEVGGHH